MNDFSMFPLPFEGLELPRFLLTLDQTLAGMPGARVTFVELDALLADDPEIAGIEVTMHRSLVEACRAPGDPELPDDEEEFWSGELSLVSDADGTILRVDLERNVYVMPAVVRIVEDLLQRLGASSEEVDEDDCDDVDEDEFDNFDEYDLDDDDDDGLLDEDDEDGDDAEETEDGGVEEWDGAEAFEQLRAMAQNTFGEVNIEGEGSFVLQVSWEDPPMKKDVRVRSFVPVAAMGQGDQASWVALECPVCPMSKLSTQVAVGLNAELDFGLALDGDAYTMTQSFALRSLDGSFFVEMVIALAEQADMLNSAIEQGVLENA